MVQVVYRDCVDIFGTFLDALDHYHSLSLYFARSIDLSLKSSANHPTFLPRIGRISSAMQARCGKRIHKTK